MAWLRSLLTALQRELKSCTIASTESVAYLWLVNMLCMNLKARLCEAYEARRTLIPQHIHMIPRWGAWEGVEHLGSQRWAT